MTLVNPYMSFPATAAGSITYRGVTAVFDTSGTGSRTFTLPAGTADGDLAVLLCVNYATGAFGTPPSGWTARSGPTDVTNGGCVVAYTRDTAISAGDVSTGSIAASLVTTFNSISAVLLTLGGASIATPMDATPTTETDTAANNPAVQGLPAITTATNNALIIKGTAVLSGSGGWSSKPGTLTERLAETRADVSWWIGTAVQATAGAFARDTVTMGGTMRENSVTLAIRPA